jgi:solute carrier family 25 phosphate transporter 23/24/25/41
MDGESQNAQDARIEELFRALDAEGKNELDIDNLRAGLKRIDHRTVTSNIALCLGLNIFIALKNASALVEKILQSIDTNHDDRISFEGLQL